MTRPPRTRKKGGGDTTDKNHPACHVLLIEDDEGHAELIRRAFLKHKKEYRLTITGSLADARTIIDRDLPDLILADWLLPDGKGIEILPTDRDAITIPVIIITSHGNEELAVEMLKAGVVDYIVKSESSFKELPHIAERALRDWGNIVQRKRVEEALRESEEKYRTVFENTGTSMVIVEESTIISLANKEFAQLTGFSKDDIEGKKRWTEFVVKEDLERMLAQHQLRRQNQEKALTHYEFRVVTKSGDIHTIYLSIDMIPGTTKSVASLMDITERKRAEGALRESEEKFRSLVEHALEGILILDLQGTILFANNAAARTIEADDCAGLIGRNVMEFIAPESREDVVRDFIQVSQGHDAYLAQYNAISAKGNKFCVESIGKVISYEGEPADLISIQDITERKRAEDALRESEERYRILTDAAHDAIYTLSPEGVVRYVNSGGAALIGMPPEKIVGLSLGMLYHAEIAQEFRENLDKVISTKRPVRYDAKFWHEDQDQITWLDAQLVPQLGPDGSVVQVIGISRSITDRKQAEMLLKRFNEELEWQVRLRTAELEHTNTLLEAAIIQRTVAEESVRKSLNERELLLREIHHRVRNNLQIILSLLSLQSRNIKDQKLLDTLGEFQNRIMAMAHIHERMCRADDISRIDLSEIVTFLGSNLFKSYKVDPQHIRLNVEMKDLQITIDSAIPVSLIINELISNSIKHAFPTGTPGEITIAGRREADTIVLSIRDTGIGIPKDLDWMRNKQSLGLRLVTSLVEQLNGTIELDRSVGTAFTIVVQEKIS